VFIIAMMAVTGMLLFVVPTFANLYKSLGGKLPAPTQMLVNISHAFKFMFPIMIVLWTKYKHTEQVRSVVDPMKLKMPIFGSLFQKIALSRFTRNLGTMMH